MPCLDRSQVSHAVNLFDMSEKYADVMTTAECAEALPRRCRVTTADLVIRGGHSRRLHSDLPAFASAGAVYGLRTGRIAQARSSG